MIYNSIVPYSHKEIVAIFRSLFSTHNFIDDCEEKLYEITGKYAVLTDSGLSAILVYLYLNNIISGDEIIVPAYLCKHVGRGLQEKGYKLKFVDVNNNYNISTSDLLKKISSKTKVVLAVHTYGIPCDIHKIKEITKQNNALLIEDSAQSFCTTVNNIILGTIGDCGIYSFGWFKPISAMGGGAFISDDLDLIKKAKKLLCRKSTIREKSTKGAKGLLYLNKYLYHKIVVGSYNHVQNQINKAVPDDNEKHSIVKYRSILNIQASLALCQFKRVQKYNEKRIANAVEIIENIKSGRLVVPEEATKYPLLRLPVFIEGIEQDKVNQISKILFENMIDAPMLYPYLPSLLNIEAPLCCTAKKLSDKTLHLPIHPGISKKDIKNIIQQLKLMKDL
ncbi:MAG: DegT/DnrJ/EryC1/StrS family aminotransferase [Pedobacter sp.]